MENRGEEPHFPPVAHDYLVRWWLEIGPTLPAGVGESPLPLRYIADEMDVLGVAVGPWEAQAIRSMSRAFINGRQEARKPSCPPPYAVDAPEDAVDAGFKAFAAFGRAGKRGSGQAR